MEAKNADNSAIKEQLNRLLSEPKMLALERHLRREVNVFDILKISETEIRHSNMLAWLLDANQNHGLGDYFIRQLYLRITGEENPENVDFKKFKIYREEHNIDLLLVNPESKIVICIENKINAAESKTQLKKYYDIVQRDYPDYTKYFRFLTVEGDASSNPEIWPAMDYEFVMNTLQAALEIYAVSLSARAENIIKQYLSVIERKVKGMDKETERLLGELRAQYPEAVKTIAEGLAPGSLRKQASAAVRRYFTENALPEGFYVDEEATIDSYIRLHSRKMDELFPPAPGSAWVRHGHDSQSKYYYEIHSSKNGDIAFYVTFSVPNLTEAEHAHVNELRAQGNVKNLRDTASFKMAQYFMRGRNFFDKEAGEMNMEKLTEALDTAFAAAAEYEKNL